MEEPIVKMGLVFLGTIQVFAKKVVISKPFNTTTIPFSQIAHVEANMVTQRFKIKTSSGEIISLIINGKAETVKQAIEERL